MAGTSPDHKKYEKYFVSIHDKIFCANCELTYTFQTEVWIYFDKLRINGTFSVFYTLSAMKKCGDINQMINIYKPGLFLCTLEY